MGEENIETENAEVSAVQNTTDDAAETMMMNNGNGDASGEVEKSERKSFKQAEDPDNYKVDEAGWTIPGLNEQYEHTQKIGAAAGSDGQAAAPAAPAAMPDSINRDAMIGRVIQGQYTLEKVLGEGGMGTVYLANQATFDRKAAIKFLLPELGKNEEMVQRFYREAKSAGNLRHPSIVQTYTFGCTEDNLMYLAMEYVDGVTLHRQILRNGPLSWPDVCDLGSQLADALAAAHAAKVIHRDLKPENIILHPLNDRVIPKILDFGIAKVVSNDGKEATLTRLGTVFGTPSYMSPEQAQGIPIDHRTDIYSLGVIFYVMLSGKLPIVAASPAAQLMAVNLQQPEPFDDNLQNAIPESLQNLIFKMLAKMPADRPQSMLEVRDALEAIAKGAPVANDDGHTMITRAPRAKNTSAGLVMAALGLGVIAGWFGGTYYPLDVVTLLNSHVAHNAADANTDLALAELSTEPVLLESSTDEVPAWFGETGIHLDDGVAHFYANLEKSDNIGQSYEILEAKMVEMAVMKMASAIKKEPYATIFWQEPAQHKLLLQDSASDDFETLLDNKAMAINALVESRYAELFEKIDFYWQKYSKGQDVYYKVYSHAALTSSNFKIENYFSRPADTYKKLGLKLGAFCPSMIWLHGAVSGPVVVDVKPKSLAYQAGLQNGDVILSIEDNKLDGLSEATVFFKKWEKRQPAKRVSITISRGGQQLDLYLFDKSAGKNGSKKGGKTAKKAGK